MELGARRAPVQEDLLAIRLVPFLALALLLGGLAEGARAQPSATPAAAEPAAAEPGGPPRWQFSVTPYAWLPALRGNLQTPLPRIGDRSLSLGSGTVISDLSTVPVMGAGEARYGRFSMIGDIFYAGLQQDISTRDIAFQGGHARVVSTIATGLGLYRVVETSTGGLDIGAGFRFWNFNNKISLNPGLQPGVIQKTSTNWADPLLGARYQVMLSPRFGITLYGDVGGFNTGSRLTWQAMGSLDYNLSQSTTLRGGWRYLSVDKTSGSIGIDLGFNGPFFAASFRF
jgi:hypothetical protein